MQAFPYLFLFFLGIIQNYYLQLYFSVHQDDNYNYHKNM
jgi:hypothetical protein